MAREATRKPPSESGLPGIVLRGGSTIIQWGAMAGGYISIYFADGTTESARPECCPDCDTFLAQIPGCKEALARPISQLECSYRWMEAEEKAAQLLNRLLTKKQQEQYELHGYFDVTSQHRRKYRISNATANNVYSFKEERSFCCVLHSHLPLSDQMIGQLLALKYNEDEFLAKAI